MDGVRLLRPSGSWWAWTSSRSSWWTSRHRLLPRCLLRDVPCVLPVNLTSWDPTPSQAVILSDVADLGLLHVVPWVGTHVATASPPCPPWSRAGEQDGLGDPHDMSFLAALAWARPAAPLALLMELLTGCRIIRTSPSYLPLCSGLATVCTTLWYMTMPPLVHAPDAVGLPLCCGVMSRCLSLPPLPSLVPVPAPRIFRCRKPLSLILRVCRSSGTTPILPSCLVLILTCTQRKMSSRGGWPLLISRCAHSVLGTPSSISLLLLPWLTGAVRPAHPC